MEGHGLYRRRRLPHWDLPGATYFVTACLAGSIPARGLLDLQRYRSVLAKPARAGQPQSDGSELRRWKKTFARADWWLDRHPSVRHFADRALAEIVVNACLYWAARRYDLLAYVVMPSHLHWVFRPLAGADVGQVADMGQEDVGQVANLPKPGLGPIQPGQVSNLPHDTTRSARVRIMHTLKLRTARQCNRLLGRSGVFWQDESYDHCVRNDDELERIIQYVEYNPVKAGLAATPEQWQFSSAPHRAASGLLFGQPLPASIQQ
jgi:type I restriction enzyme R subunit